MHLPTWHGRQRQRDTAQVIQIQPQVDAGTVCAPMTQKIADALEGNALAKQVRCERVPQAVDPAKRDIQAAVVDTKAKRIAG